MLQHRRAHRTGKTTVTLSAIAVSMLAACPASAGQATAQLHVGITITNGSASARAGAQAASPTSRIKKTTVTRDRVSTIVLTYR
jgi:hypothetical protein